MKKRHQARLWAAAGISTAVLLMAAAESTGARAFAAAVSAPTSPEAAARAAVVSVLERFAQAIDAKDVAAVAKLALFPMPVAYTEFSGAVETHSLTVSSAKEAASAAPLHLDREFLQALRAPDVRVGRPANCESTTGVPGGTVDRSKGEPAIVIKGTEAEVSYLAVPCDEESHIVSLKLRKQGTMWKLYAREVRLFR